LLNLKAHAKTLRDLPHATADDMITSLQIITGFVIAYAGIAQIPQSPFAGAPL
jgi:hypothetical protein